MQQDGASLCIDDLLMEVENQIKTLDQRVASIAVQLHSVADVDKLQDLVGDAMDANQRATVLSELQLLLMDQKKKKGVWHMFQRQRLTFSRLHPRDPAKGPLLADRASV